MAAWVSTYWSGGKLATAKLRVVFKMRDFNDNSGVYVRIPIERANPGCPFHYGYEVQIDNHPKPHLRTILTRFKLELVLIGDSPEVDGIGAGMSMRCPACWKIIWPFARGDSGRATAQPTTWRWRWRNCAATPSATPRRDGVFPGLPVVTGKPASFKRCLANCRVQRGAARQCNFDQGQSRSPAIIDDHDRMTMAGDSAANARGSVQSRFLRLDDARNQDEGGTGLWALHRPRHSRARMAATSRSATVRWADFAPAVRILCNGPGSIAILGHVSLAPACGKRCLGSYFGTRPFSFPCP